METLCSRGGGRNQGPQNPHPLYNTASKTSHIDSAQEFEPRCFHALRVGIFIEKQRNLLGGLPPQASEVRGRPERSAAQAGLWNLLLPTRSHQGSGRWGGGGADSLGGSIQEAKRGRQQAGQKGAEQVEGYYEIASIKPVAVVKLSAFQRLYFLLSL